MFSCSLEEDKTCLFLGDLSCFCQEQDIFHFFRDVGEIQSIRLMRSKTTNKCLGYGFITFVDVSVLPIALGLNGELLLGRRIKIARANPRATSLPERQTSRSVSNPTNSFTHGPAQLHFSFVTHQLRFLVTEVTIRNIFSQFGEIDDVKFKKSSHDTKGQRGYGFIRFSDREIGLEAAIQATFVISQVVIDDVLYDCCLSRSLEAAPQHSMRLLTQRKSPVVSLPDYGLFDATQLQSPLAIDRTEQMSFSTYYQSSCTDSSKDLISSENCMSVTRTYSSAYAIPMVCTSPILKK